ncbi:hypothetical protein TVAG_411120 [Trichomonas vaginalis G3]|uniref:Transmembrane protein n=1 Tax=Trichomonas vaginalis (strain ATCC PRA-98 / G3) TaxID=412133 RepID=A2DXL7_TRIV3|nr:hypothetical protein TVAGG3_0047830 [Trichomonas vaginalis G3]EAY14846.1 hypothetical protein TVAG_411120 [Trichomonas vaginalis G3]KAI5541173.1 hypothetical protein TVAGG3_0047830 [Trichomonas vaginalis G3]|eukprot:XP_001327069.1 hypothetical protein [Trichomonas vaginalis G3]
MQLADFYEEGGCKFLLIYAAIFLTITVGSIGQAVWLFIWWGRVKYDFSVRRNGNDLAFGLYVSILSGWIFGAIFWFLGVYSAIQAYIVTKCRGKTGSFTELLKNTSFLAGIGFLISCFLVIIWSTDKKCAELYSKSLYPGNSTKSYQTWYNKTINSIPDEKRDLFIQNFNKWRCNEGQTYTEIFFGIFIFAFILLILSIPFCKYVLELNVALLLKS